MPSQFDSVLFDEQSCKAHAALKEKFVALECTVNELLHMENHKCTVLGKLQEAFMWAGVCIRDCQLARDEKKAAQ